MTQPKPKRKRRSVSRCSEKVKGGKCKGKYRLTHEGDLIPIFTCDKCGHQNFAWKRFYTEYLNLYKVKENWDNKKHQVTCIIGFFCRMYKEFYNVDYVFVPTNPNPYGAKECKDAWTLLAAFSNDAIEVRKYIYWVFKKGINKSASISSFGYINAPGLVRKYKLYAEKRKTFTRDSKLPKKYILWCEAYIPDIFQNYELKTMNDLGALLSYTNVYLEDTDGLERQAIDEAIKCNLIKNGKINIRG